MLKRNRVLIFFVLLQAVILLMSSCRSDNPPLQTDATSDFPTQSESAQSTESRLPPWNDIDNNRLIIYGDNTPYYTLMRGDKSSAYEYQGTIDLNVKIKELTGKSFEIKTDFLKPGEDRIEDIPLIIIGSTAYNDSIEAMKGLEKNQYRITSSGDRIVIVAQNDSVLPLAINRFINDYLSASTDSNGGYVLTVPEGISYLSDPSEYAPFAFLRDKQRFTSTSEYLYTVANPSSEINISQGGYSDGNYFYQAFIKKDTSSNEQNNVVRIVKSDAKTGKLVKTSGDLALNHANDITYNPKLNALLVVHNNPNRTWVTLVDAETLEVIRTVTLPYSIYCMSYNETRDMYVVGISGGQNFRYLDADFNPVGGLHIATTKTAGYVTQGVSSDNDFIYFVLYRQNVITVYDWEGNFVTIIELDVGSIEPENISVVDGEIFVTCISGGAKVFRIVPKSVE